MNSNGYDAQKMKILLCYRESSTLESVRMTSYEMHGCNHDHACAQIRMEVIAGVERLAQFVRSCLYLPGQLVRQEVLL